MRILFTTPDMQHRGGTMTFTETMCEAFRRLGHDVMMLTAKRGSWYNIPHLQSTSEHFDLVCVNQTSSYQLLNQFDVSWDKLYYFQHSPLDIIAHAEQVTIEEYDKHFSLSREIKGKAPADSVLIDQPIDIQKFELIPKPGIGAVLSMCQSQQANKAIEHACKEKGYVFRAAPTLPAERVDSAELIRYADVVVGIGRAIPEAICMGRNAVVYDTRHYQGEKADGFLASEVVYEISRTANFSGRSSVSGVGLTDELRDAVVYKTPKLIEAARKRHDSIEIAKNILV